MSKKITLQEHLKKIASMGGKAVWLNVSKEERSKRMKKVSLARFKK